MKNKFNNVYLLIAIFGVIFPGITLAQSWDQMENEYRTLLKNKQNDLALVKAKEMYSWVRTNESDTSIHLPISLKYIGNAFINNDSAIVYYDIALNVLKKQKRENHIQTAKLHYNKSNKYGLLNNQALSLKEAESSIQVLTYLNFPEYPFCLWPLNIAAKLCLETNKLEQAYNYYSLVNIIIKEHNGKNDQGYINSLFALANINWRNEKYDSAKVQYKEALNIQKLLIGKNNIEYRNNLGLIANLFSAHHDFSEAVNLYEEYKEIEAEVLGKKSFRYAFGLNGLADVYKRIGAFNESEKLYLQVLDIMRHDSITESIEYVQSLHSLASVYRLDEKFDNARTTMKEAAGYTAKFKGKQNILYAEGLMLLASINSDEGKYKESIDLNKEALKIIKIKAGENSTRYSGCINNLAIDYKNIHDYKNAELLYLESIKIARNNLMIDPIRYNDVLLNIGNYYDEVGNYNIAEKYYNELFALKIIYLEKNFIWMSNEQRQKFWNNESDFFNFLNSFVVKSISQNPQLSQLSFNSNLFAKSILLETANSLKEQVQKSSDISIKKIYNELVVSRTIYNKVVSEGSDDKVFVFSLANQVDSLDKLLSMKITSIIDYKRVFSLTWKDVQSNMTDDEALIEFARYYDDNDGAFGYLGLIVKKGDKYPALVKLCSEDELKRFSPEKELSDLYSLLWKPISGKLTGIKKIYYTPAGLINNIPLQALYVEKDGVKEYLMDKFSLNQLISTRYLALGLKQKEQEPIETSIALFGGVDYEAINSTKTDEMNAEDQSSFILNYVLVSRGNKDSLRSGLEYLPGTKKEVEDIAFVLKQNKWDVSIATEKNASENSIKSFSEENSKSILHIATHGFAIAERTEYNEKGLKEIKRGYEKYTASDNPMIRSGLLLSGANWTWQGKGDTILKMTNEDGVLTAYELSQLDLSKTKLVVLSACQTGKGAMQGSEGTFGLKRALKLAGVENMIVSLWDVPDEPTMEMMTLFYTELANTKKPVSSFETAQKAMRLKYPDEPKMWAGFVFVR